MASMSGGGPAEPFIGDNAGRAGNMSGLTPSIKADPVNPTAVERTNPGCERSMSHQSNGLAKARVTEICVVDVQASLR